MEFKASLPCIQEPTTGIYLEPDENNGVFLTYFCTTIFYALLFSPHPAQIILLNLVIIIIFGYGAQMKLLIMQLFPTSHYFIPLRSDYSHQHPVLKHHVYVLPSL
jgi:hypothetical protein